MCTKVQGTGIRFKKVILKGFLRLSIQPVQLGGGSRARAARAKKTHQPSNTINNLRDPMLTCYRPTMGWNGRGDLERPRGRTCSRTVVKLRRGYRILNLNPAVSVLLIFVSPTRLQSKSNHCILHTQHLLSDF